MPFGLSADWGARPLVTIITKARNLVRHVCNHPANRGQEGRALLRAVHYQARAKILRQRPQARLGERSRLWVDAHRVAAVKAVYGNPPDYREMMVWRSVLKSGDLFLDVGANIGGYSIWAGNGAQR